MVEILCAAIKSKESGMIVSFAMPHGHIYIYQKMGLILHMHKWKDGFLTTKGEFVDRHKAYEIALKSKQITQPKRDKSLTTSDMGWDKIPLKK